MSSNDSGFSTFDTDGEPPYWLKKPKRTTQSPSTQQDIDAIQSRIRYEADWIASQQANRSTVSTAGIVLLATISAFGFWYSVAFTISLAVSSPRPWLSDRSAIELGEYFGFGRLLFATFTAVILTASSWLVAVMIVEK